MRLLSKRLTSRRFKVVTNTIIAYHLRTFLQNVSTIAVSVVTNYVCDLIMETSRCCCNGVIPVQIAIWISTIWPVRVPQCLWWQLRFAAQTKGNQKNIRNEHRRPWCYRNRIKRLIQYVRLFETSCLTKSNF